MVISISPTDLNHPREGSTVSEKKDGKLIAKCPGSAIGPHPYQEIKKS
jgi:hypothetical protein